MKTKFTKTKLYKIQAYMTINIQAIGITFPLYWIITDSNKTPQQIKDRINQTLDLLEKKKKKTKQL